MADRKKILYIITKSNFGGAQRQVFDLTTNLSKEKYETAVALGGNGLLKTKLESAGIRTVPILSMQRDIKFLGDLKAFFEIFTIIKRERPDIVHLHSSKAGGLGALAIFLLRLASKLRVASFQLQGLFYTVHGWPFKEKRSAWWRFNAKFFSWLTVILADKTIVVSEDDLLLAKEFILADRKVTLVHNGISGITFETKEKSRETILPKHTAASGEIWIGTIAELHKNKGQDFAIRAFAELKNSEPRIFVIIGGGEERRNLENLITELKLKEKVFLVGQITDAARYLKAFDIFTLPSQKEGLPYTILEAGAARLPVVASAVGGIPEIITDMTSGILVKPGQPEEIKKAWEFLLEHPARRANFGDALAKNVAENFSLEKMIRDTERVYESS